MSSDNHETETLKQVENPDIYLEKFTGYQVKCLNCSHVESFMDKNKALKERKSHRERNPGHQVIVSFHEYEANKQGASEHSEIVDLEGEA